MVRATVDHRGPCLVRDRSHGPPGNRRRTQCRVPRPRSPVSPVRGASQGVPGAESPRRGDQGQPDRGGAPASRRRRGRTRSRLDRGGRDRVGRRVRTGADRLRLTREDAGRTAVRARTRSDRQRRQCPRTPGGSADRTAPDRPDRAPGQPGAQRRSYRRHECRRARVAVRIRRRGDPRARPSRAAPPVPGSTGCTSTSAARV